MAKRREDFVPESPPWLIEDWFPLGHRGMDTAPEGSFKTILGSWFAVCVASGSKVFGLPTNQGPVLIIDEETPKTSLEYHLERFSEGLGVRYRDLPIHIYSMEGFRFGRKSMDTLSNIVDIISPVFIRMDSMIALMPSGRQRLSENSDNLGETIRDNLNQLLTKDRAILLAAHSKKYIAELSLDEIQGMEMGSIVRGHASIVGEGCDTGYIIKKISTHPNPTRFCVITKPRRQAIPAGKIKYIEMVEESYGRGWARLEEISTEKLPPSKIAIELYRLFKVPDPRGNFNHSSSWIRRTCALYATKECRLGLEELLLRKAIVVTTPQNYELNQKRASQCDPDYLAQLEMK